MAKSPEIGSTEATTLIFPKKSNWEEYIAEKRKAKTRAKSANGALAKVIDRLVENDNFDRRAARMVAALDAIEDDEDLHVTFHHLMDGIAKLGIDKRAMAAPDFFTAPTAQTAAAGAKNAKGKGKGKDGEPDLTNVTAIGEAARKVTESAGAAPGA